MCGCLLRRNRHHFGTAPTIGPHITINNVIGFNNRLFGSIHRII
jgi:hypothetical protein